MPDFSTPSRIGFALLALALGACSALDSLSDQFTPVSTPKTQESEHPFPESEQSRERVGRALPDLAENLAEKGLILGEPVFVRIFKRPQILEVWVRAEDSYKHFRSYPIKRFAGDIGPKIAQGDGQSPEGFYSVSRFRMNPYSRYHLGFNLGFPNYHDRERGWSGRSLMVHGKEVSRGCYAMGDSAIEEIYALCEAALRRGQPSFSVQCLPFALTHDNLARYRDHPWHDFWKTLQEGYLYFEKFRIPPAVAVGTDGRYAVGHAPPARKRGARPSPRFALPIYVPSLGADRQAP